MTLVLALQILEAISAATGIASSGIPLIRGWLKREPNGVLEGGHIDTIRAVSPTEARLLEGSLQHINAAMPRNQHTGGGRGSPA